MKNKIIADFVKCYYEFQYSTMRHGGTVLIVGEYAKQYCGDTIEDLIISGAEFKFQDDYWFLFDKDGEVIESGESVTDILGKL